MTFATYFNPGVSLQGGSGSGGGTPAGSTTQIQYNNAGAFAGASGLTTNGTNLTFGSSSQLLWSTDLILTRRAAANLRFGAADAAAPVSQTLSVQSVVAGTSNTAGSNLTITGSQGTGTGAGGSIIFQVAPAGGSGTAQNALATALTINSAQQVVFPDGSNTVPSIRGADDNSGFYFSGNNIRIAADGFLVYVFDGAGNTNLRSSAAVRWSNSGDPAGTADAILYREAAGITGVRGTSTTTGGALSFIEQTAPSAPATNGVRIYAEDNGAGKTRLMALFATGVAQQIAIEP